MTQKDQFNVRVPVDFQRDVKIYAIENDMTVSEVLQKSFNALKILNKIRKLEK
ncbi:hypothetical protein [Falsihalocynthiibacter arcticus]|uniref:hypothetical protein n=1 Tax=Falsihalocynthiibacter arcticus TaxID=1579316 RepID=UPI0012E90946|nr:hypothetical protein [Falsihalocynthiibacter arcticus]